MSKGAFRQAADSVDLEKGETGGERNTTGMHSKGRSALISSLGSVDEQTKTNSTLTINVDKCRLWEYNDRDYSRITMENGKSLIDSIQQNSQLQPVIARKDPSGEKDYEILVGVRRFWACQRTVAKTIDIVVVDVDDKTAYKFMQTENSDRDDTSIYEKATNAKKVIHDLYGGSQKEYCLDNNINEKTLSSWMAVVDIDPQIIKCIPDALEISAAQATRLRSTCNKSTKAKTAVIEKAANLKGESMTTTTFLKAIIAAGVDSVGVKKVASKPKYIQVGSDKKAVTVSTVPNGGMTIKIKTPATEDMEATLNAVIKSMLKE